ncbi:MAG TPA: hypothetical protein PKJ84_10345 [Anaerolineales bacterium]|nr:hypothetical protein [Anaerolineales bacterium]HNO94563.1 hypothetical protein [Anaerolineales bacterium]
MSEERRRGNVSPSDAGQRARTAANKLRNIAKAKARREADAEKRKARRNAKRDEVSANLGLTLSHSR